MLGSLSNSFFLAFSLEHNIIILHNHGLRNMLSHLSNAELKEEEQEDVVFKQVLSSLTAMIHDYMFSFLGREVQTPR